MPQSPLQQAPSGTIVTASRRVSRQLRLDYDRERQGHGASVWEAPDILPIQAWKIRLWRELAARDPVQTPVLLSRVQEDALWREAIRQSPAASELLDLTTTAAMAGRARDYLYAWDLLYKWDLPRRRDAFNESQDTEAFFEWLLNFETQLHRQGWVTSGQLASLLRNQTAAGTQVSHAGFAEMDLADSRLFEACAAKEYQHWSPVSPVNATLRPASTTAEELYQAAAWARAKLTNSPGSLRIGVMIPGLAGLAALAERIFDDVLHPSALGSESTQATGSRAFALATGTPSDEVPVIAMALLLLGLETGLTLAEAGGLLRSPLFAFDRIRGAEIDARLRRYRAHNIRLQDVAELFPQLVKATAKRLESASRNRRPSEWSAVFAELVKSAGWRERTPSRVENQGVGHQGIEHWKDLLSELASLDRVMAHLTYDEALSELRKIAHDSRFHAHANDPNEDAPVQIMDLQEGAAARMNFDALWIAGLHAGAWPEPPRPNPFLPLALQADLPHSSARLKLESARRVTERLLASAGEVVCSFPRLLAEEELRASPLIENLPLSALLEFAPATVLEKVYATPVVLEEFRDLPVPIDSARNAFRGGASVLKHQAACPFRAFAVHRLGARELDEEELGVSPRERGTAVHQALELLWQELKSSRELKARSPEDLVQLIKSVAHQALENNNAPARFRDLEQRRLEELLAEWLNAEQARAPFTVVASEMGHEASIGGMVLSIRPDRVDRYEHDGKFALIDYKTGQDVKTAYWDGPRPDEPQLPLYAVKGGYPVSEVMFARLVPGNVKSLWRAGDELQESLPQWRDVLEELAEQFAAGHAEVDPKEGRKTCRLCRLQALCRIDEVGTGESEDEEAAGANE